MSILISILAIIIAVVAHEWAHGFMSYLLGDETAKKDGRLSLNPLKHIDMYGFLCLLVFHVGWAKPVHINPYMYKNRKLGTALTAFAGPFMNLIMAFLAIFSIGIIEKFGLYYTSLFYLLYSFLLPLAYINIGLALFNLIPIPPLDGSKIVAAILPDSVYNKLIRYEKFGLVLLFVFIIFGFDMIIDPIHASIFNSMYEFVYNFLQIGVGYV